MSGHTTYATVLTEAARLEKVADGHDAIAGAYQEKVDFFAGKAAEFRGRAEQLRRANGRAS